jgi:hypothetical protein
VKLPRGAGDPKVLAAAAAPDAIVGEAIGDTMVKLLLYIFSIQCFLNSVYNFLTEGTPKMKYYMTWERCRVMIISKARCFTCQQGESCIYCLSIAYRWISLLLLLL